MRWIIRCGLGPRLAPNTAMDPLMGPRLAPNTSVDGLAAMHSKGHISDSIKSIHIFAPILVIEYCGHHKLVYI